MRLLYAILRKMQTLVWAVIVAFMLGLHNFYKGDDKTVQNIGKIEIQQTQDDDAPKGGRTTE